MKRVEQSPADCVCSSGYSVDKVVRCRGRLQRDGDGAAWTQSGGPFQLLLPEVQPKDRPAFGRPDGMTQTLMQTHGIRMITVL